ncbi:hypothetical protein [Actinoplanes sp. NPDC049681]|uniref:hypothetical protein n=1 Tax=Actinoplanes sp. NPDC049681 TaxID=3363905 RepID=UPI0037ACCF65
MASKLIHYLGPIRLTNVGVVAEKGIQLSKPGIGFRDHVKENRVSGFYSSLVALFDTCLSRFIGLSPGYLPRSLNLPAPAQVGGGYTREANDCGTKGSNPFPRHTPMMMRARNGPWAVAR